MSFVTMQARLGLGLSRALHHNCAQRVVTGRMMATGGISQNLPTRFFGQQENRRGLRHRLLGLKHGFRGLSVRTYADSALTDALNTKHSEQKVVVYGKTWCGFSDDVIQLFSKLNVQFENVDLEGIPEGEDILDALYGITGIRTVPQVFVGGNFIGGCDDTFAAWKSGKLKELFEDAGVSSSL